jgi:Immunoglobulin-like domain of bacterial spore germination
MARRGFWASPRYVAAAMHGRRMKILVAVVVLGLAATGCTGADRATEALSPSPSPSVGSPAPVTSSSPGEPSIVIETPFVNGEVANRVSITGTADVLDASLVVRVLDEHGFELAATVVEASCGDGCLGTFAAELFFFVERRQRGTVEVSGVSGDGGPAVASVPVLLVPA